MSSRPFPNKPIVDGQEIATGKTFPAIRPATGEPFAEVHRAGRREVDAAVAAAQKAFQHWSQTPVRERQRYLARLLGEVRGAHEEISALIALEQGKPVGEARAI